MTIAVEPDPIPALVETKIKATITYKRDSLETAVAGAKVTLTKTNPDKAKTVFTGTTNSDGDANFVLLIRISAAAKKFVPTASVAIPKQAFAISARAVKILVSA